MQTWNAHVLLETKLLLGEGICWHAPWQRFLFVDIEAGLVGRFDPCTKKLELRNVGKRVGTVVPTCDGQLLVALQGSLERLDFETGTLQFLHSIETNKPNNRCNDGKCDAAGRLWVGTMHADAQKHQGALYCYDGSLQKKLDAISISNGLCWNKENTIMYYIDSLDYHIRSYGFDLETATLSAAAKVVAITEPGLLPDGMCMDTEGMLWVAMWGGGCVQRFDPGTGAPIGKVVVAVPQVTSCAFGGADLRQLVITTARTGMSNAQLKKHPLSGALFYVTTGAQGLAVNHFHLSNTLGNE